MRWFGHKYRSYSDETLMEAISAGEVAAFDELYERYAKRLLLYFSRMLNFNRQMAEDALQDLFLKIAEQPERFDTTRSFKTWFFSAAGNYCKNYYRHQDVIKKHLKNEYINEEAADHSFAKFASRIDASGFNILLEQVLNGLPVEKKEAFLLRYQENRSLAEIAKIQDCPEGSVKSRLHYTLKILEEKMIMYKPVKE